MPVTLIGSKWSSGDLVFYDIATGTAIMTIYHSTTGVAIPTLTTSSTLAPNEQLIPSGQIDANHCTDRFMWTCPAGWTAGCTVVGIAFCQSVVEATGASSTCMPRKVPSGTAIAAGSSLLAAALNLKTGVTANTICSCSLNATPANLVLAATDSIALDFTNALTEYIGECTIYVQKN